MTLNFHYSVGHDSARKLHALAKTPAQHAAITRLEDFRGDVSDVEIAAQLYDGAGMRAVARELRRVLD